MYNVNKTSIRNAGTYTIYAQQWHLLRLGGNCDPDPRKQTVIDINKDISNYKEIGDYVCIMGNFNEVLGKNPSLMSNICLEHSMYDVLNKLHPHEINKATYIRGKKRLDYFLLSNNFPQPSAMGHCPYYYLYNSDHRPMFLDLPIDKKFRIKNKIISNDIREISSKLDNITLFVDVVHKHLMQNNIFHQMKEFLASTKQLERPWEIANMIDTQITKGINVGLRECFKPKYPPWSLKLHHASMTVRFWCVLEDSVLFRRDNSESLNQIREEIKDLPDIIPDISIIRKQIKRSQKNLRLIRAHAVEHRKNFLLELKTRIAMRRYENKKRMNSQKALEIINKQLTDSKMWKILKKKFSNFSNVPLTKVKIMKETVHIHPQSGKEIFVDPTTNNIVTEPTFIIVDTKKELEKAILERNQKHFKQAKHTPWFDAPLNEIGSDNDYDLHRNAMCEPIELDRDTFVETKELLSLLKTEATRNKTSWSGSISFEQFITGFLHWDEGTSTSILMNLSPNYP